MNTELETPTTEVKAKRGRPAGSKNGPKVNDLTLKFDGQKLTASTGAAFVNGIWSFGGYNAVNAAAELEAAQTAVETLKVAIAALKGLPEIVPGDYAKSIKGLTSENAGEVLKYLFNR